MNTHSITTKITEQQISEIRQKANAPIAQIIRKLLIDNGYMTGEEIMKVGTPLSHLNKKYSIPQQFANEIKIICNAFDVNIRDVYTSRRHKEEVYARHAVRYFLRKEKKLNLIKVASLTLNCNHSTVISSIIAFEDLLETDKPIAKKYNSALRVINRL